MLRLTANKTKLYTLVADYVDNLPPMRKTTFTKYPRTHDYALEWATEREKGRAFLSACMGRPLLKIDIDEKRNRAAGMGRVQVHRPAGPPGPGHGGGVRHGGGAPADRKGCRQWELSENH